MRNQPKYNFFKNTLYALNGLVDIVKTEKSFKIELLIFFLSLVILFYINVTYMEKLLMFITIMGVLIAEAINSAIERVVDLVTQDYHKLAGLAKDVGSSVVFLSIILCAITWFTIIIHNLSNIF